jgi:hypothetical protein
VGQPVRVVPEAAVEELLRGPELLDTLAEGFVALSRGEVVAPARPEVAVA